MSQSQLHHPLHCLASFSEFWYTTILALEISAGVVTWCLAIQLTLTKFSAYNEDKNGRWALSGLGRFLISMPNCVSSGEVSSQGMTLLQILIVMTFKTPQMDWLRIMEIFRLDSWYPRQQSKSCKNKSLVDTLVELPLNHNWISIFLRI